MKRKINRLSVILLVFAIAILSCKGGLAVNNAADDTPEPQHNVSRTPFPSSIDITLEQGTAATAVIGPEGGTLETVDTNGTQYVLTVPAGALIVEEEITITPIASVEGELVGDTFLAGVKLLPEGLHFLEMATIEITGDEIEEGAVGFSSENGGQDFHLISSKPGSSSLTITTTHFSEFGVSEQELGELGELITDIGAAWAENQLATGDAEQKITAFGRWTDVLIAKGELGIDLNEWERWTADFVSLLLRLSQEIEANNWNEDTPGFTDLMSKVQSLLDLWFEQMDGVVREIANKCIDGEVAYKIKSDLIEEVGFWFINRLNIGEREEHLETWRTTLDACDRVIITWQANVVTTGEDAYGQDFYSDISLGAELETGIQWPVRGDHSQVLEVEYIEGFWDDRCVPTDGAIRLDSRIYFPAQNLGANSVELFDHINIFVKILDPVYIDCSPLGYAIPADAQAPFHGAALDQLNQDRYTERSTYPESWLFELEYDPGDGIVAQFEEGPKTLTFPDVEYKLWQLVTVYAATPEE